VNQFTNYPIHLCDEQIPFGQLLSQSERDMLIENSSIVRFSRKDVIFRQNTRTSHIMIVISGMVKIYKEGSGQRHIILRLALPGSFIGMLSVMGDQIHQFSASAVEASEICFIDINPFRNIIMENGKYGLKLLSVISQEGLFIFTRLMSQSHKQLPGRIADVLLYLSREIYHSMKFTFPLTRRELAELAGTTKESFIRTLTEFKNDRIINLNGSEVEIISQDIINTLSEFG
jgi:CRP/FNR family transcriptional regulator, polysaccharide utilization system transcription regulator